VNADFEARPQPGTLFTFTFSLLLLYFAHVMWLPWMDNRTLFACQTLMAVVYAVAFLGMRQMNRHLPGTGFFALSFFSGFLGCILTVLRGRVPNFVSVVVEHFLIFSAFVLFYRGILLFFRSPRLLKQLPATALWIPLVTWYGKSLDPCECAVSAHLCGYQRLTHPNPRNDATFPLGSWNGSNVE